MKKAFLILLTLSILGFCLSSCAETEFSDINNNFDSGLPFAGLTPLSGIDPKAPEYQENSKNLGLYKLPGTAKLTGLLL